MPNGRSSRKAAWWHPLPSWQLQWASHLYLALKTKELWVRPALSQGCPRRKMAIAFLCFAHAGYTSYWTKKKDVEIRGRNLSSGPCWLGCRGTIYGHCFLGSPIVIDSIEAWRGLRHRHRVEVDELPYKTTYDFSVHQCRRVTLTSYEHLRGAVGIVRFRRASSRHKGQRPPTGGA